MPLGCRVHGNQSAELSIDHGVQVAASGNRKGVGLAAGKGNREFVAGAEVKSRRDAAKRERNA